jgi:hypothetical protein
VRLSVDRTLPADRLPEEPRGADVGESLVGAEGVRTPLFVPLAGLLPPERTAALPTLSIMEPPPYPAPPASRVVPPLRAYVALRVFPNVLVAYGAETYTPPCG